MPLELRVHGIRELLSGISESLTSTVQWTILATTYNDSGGDRGDVDQLLHLGLCGVPLVVEPSHRGVSVVAGVVVPAGPVVGVVGLAGLQLHPATVLLDDPVHVGLRKGPVTPEGSPGSPDRSEFIISDVKIKG